MARESLGISWFLPLVGWGVLFSFFEECFLLELNCYQLNNTDMSNPNWFFWRMSNPNCWSVIANVLFISCFCQEDFNKLSHNMRNSDYILLFSVVYLFVDWYFDENVYCSNINLNPSLIDCFLILLINIQSIECHFI